MKIKHFLLVFVISIMVNAQGAETQQPQSVGAGELVVAGCLFPVIIALDLVVIDAGKAAKRLNQRSATASGYDQKRRFENQARIYKNIEYGARGLQLTAAYFFAGIARRALGC